MSGNVGDASVETLKVTGKEDAPAVVGEGIAKDEAGELQNQTSKAGAVGIHLRYNFTHTRKAMQREGAGELWIGWENGAPKIKLAGSGKTSRHTHVEVTLVMDAEKSRMHFLTKVPDLQLEQCLTYGLPGLNAKDIEERWKVLEWRSRQLEEQQAQLEGAAQEDPEAPLRQHVDWTTSYRLEYVIHPETKEVIAVDLRDRREGTSEESVVKSVRLQAAQWTEDGNATDQDTYRQPAARCVRAETIAELVPEELMPPYRRASALYDLLLVLTKGPETWPQIFVLLSAAAMSGDMAVLMEDPEPPELGALSGVDLDYEATIHKPEGGIPSSDGAKAPKVRRGTLSLDLTGSGFFLRRDQEEHAELGPVVFDLIYDTAAMKLHAHADVSSMAEMNRCFSYEYSKPTGESIIDVETVQPFRFRETARLGGEDCGVFAAPLSQGREISIWVDLESQRPEEILHAEIRRGSTTLRSIAMKNWRRRTGDTPVGPRPEWGCTDLGRAHLLSNMPFRWPEELELENALASSLALQNPALGLSPEVRRVAVLELLALTGNMRMDDWEEGEVEEPNDVPGDDDDDALQKQTSGELPLLAV